MKIEEVLETVRQNGIGGSIRCFFISEDDRSDNGHMSQVNNYKYHDGCLKIYIDQYHLKEHEKYLVRTPDCQLLINKSNGNSTLTIKLFCKFVKIEKQFIYTRVFSIEYPNDEGLKTRHKVMTN